MEKKQRPKKVHSSVKIAWNAEVSGDVEIGKDSSVWYSATVRGDEDCIKIGERTNVQDAAVIHVGEHTPCIIGDDVTIGHGAIVHACTIEDSCTIGMGAIILDGAKIGKESIVGAGSLVTQNKEFPPRSMILGSPAKVKRTLSDEEICDMKKNANLYVKMSKSIKE